MPSDSRRETVAPYVAPNLAAICLLTLVLVYLAVLTADGRAEDAIKPLQR